MSCVDVWSVFSAPLFFSKSHGSKMFVKCRSLHVLCQNVAGIAGASDLDTGEVTLPRPILDPETRDGQVPDTAKAPPATNPNGCGSVSLHMKIPVHARVSGNG